jgi:2-succinyl-5-enolpyruvyl-6-hydroxy-3-cyclohexene-1-carboxylate synthase
VSRGDVSLACAGALVGTLARGGVRHACLSPGSRSTPLALALARHPDIEIHVHLDERSSAFFALGLATSLRRPVVVACTSGTAAAEMLPAVVEASQSRMPLILLTADRPPRLRGTGANQTIDQRELYGPYARTYIEPPVPASADDLPRWGDAGRDALLWCGGATPGPVQIDCPFDEPVVPAGEPVEPGTMGGWTSSGPADANPAPSEQDVAAVAEAVAGRRGLVVSGGSAWYPPGLTVHLAERLGWPVMAEPTSDARRPGQSLSAAQAVVASPWLERRRPEVILQVGAAPTTRTTQALVAGGSDLVVVDALHLEPDPEGRASLRVHADPERVVAALEPIPLAPAPDSWLDDWRLADTTARRVLDESLDHTESCTELQVARDLAGAVPDGGVLFVGNSMPVRDLDYTMAPREGLRIVANRGASGIDGLVSTSLGVAVSGIGPTFALLGDLSVLHDAGALLWYGHRNPPLTIVMPNNGGGQIFSLLGQRDLPEHERPLFTTPHAMDFGALCDAAGAGHSLVSDVWAFEAALRHAEARGGLQVIEVATDPDRSIGQRREIQAAVDEALAELS